jgi:uncharacterized membrane protein (DUF2068 family)
VRPRPMLVTVVAILQVLLNLFNFPGPWWYVFPGAEEAPAFVVYSGIVLGIVSIVAAVGLWMLKTWGFWLTIVVSVLNILLGAPGVFMAPGAALETAIAIQTVGFALVIVLVVLPSARRAFAAA